MHISEAIPIKVKLPEKMILARLGYNRHKASIHKHHQSTLDMAINYGYALCNTVGRWGKWSLEINDDHITIDGEHTIKSKALAKFLGDATEIIAFAATAGQQITDAIGNELNNGSTSRAAIFDAVGSQVADGAMDWLQAYIRQQISRNRLELIEGRFSPGYGDLPLKTQELFYNLLDLKGLGLKITESFMMMPEKSVIAISGVTGLNND